MSETKNTGHSCMTCVYITSDTIGLTTKDFLNPFCLIVHNYIAHGVNESFKIYAPNIIVIYCLFRPQSLAWEVRKQMSPGKCSSPTMNPRRSPSPAATRFLTFGTPKMTSFSWADRVRGFSNTGIDKNMKNKTPSNTNKTQSFFKHPTTRSASSPVLEASVEESINISMNNSKKNNKENDDEEGWEIVTKGRSRSKGSNLSTSSGSSVQKKPIDETMNPNNIQENSNSVPHDDKECQEKENQEKEMGVIKTENLSRSSTIIEEYVDCSVVGDLSDTLMQSSRSFNMDSVDLAFGLTESELQMKEEHEKV